MTLHYVNNHVQALPSLSDKSHAQLGDEVKSVARRAVEKSQ